jgi:hypothetical protein
LTEDGQKCCGPYIGLRYVVLLNQSDPSLTSFSVLQELISKL